MKSYQIHFILEKPVVSEVGRLGRLEFPAGRYVYTGSAKKNIETRISRHFSKNKKLRWHIDYLLGPHAKIVGVELFDGEECAVNQEMEGDSFIRRLKSREDVSVIELNPANRDTLVPSLIESMLWSTGGTKR